MKEVLKKQVSGGEKTRIGLARALYNNSDILLLDEVNSSLDKKLSEQIEEIIVNIQNVTIINISHKYNEQLIKYYDEVLIMEEGVLVDKYSGEAYFNMYS